ncbi:MAG: serine/threonine-protein kinase, partial [Ignavibacteria bacterium]|nr:serine/threonine-protein kinase [Ignavibacteria bacterium]
MIGQTISRYKILEKLGEGGMGVVYRAEDIQLKRTVALKFLPERVNKDTTAKDRFLQEAQAAASLNHPNICTIYGVEDVDGSLFIVMEYVEGGTLREKLPFAKIDDAIRIAAQIGEALQEAHSKGIVHRDIKADNIMLTSKGQAKVMDFGLAKLKGALKLTRTSSTVGTLGYMAPEQIQGGEVDHRSDIFSFGVLLFEMLTGKLPFRGEHEAAMVYSILNEQPEPIEKYLPEASSEFLHIFNRALEKDPEDRYQTVHDMVIDLRRLKKDTSRVSRLMPDIQPFQGSSESATKPSEDTPRRAKKSWKWMAVGGIVILVTAVSAILLLWHPKETIDSLAVLPFSHKGDDPNINILAEEIPGALIEKLNGLANIKVRSRSTTLRFRNSEKEPLEFGKELGVHAVLTGSVELRDPFIIVTIELSDVNEGYQLWGPHAYKEKLSDMYLVQEKIAKDVTENLRIKVSGAEQEKLAKRSTENAEAYKNYLLGLHFRYIETPEGTEKAISYFRLALEKDPNHALALAG